jgi:hypothetical protein
MRFTKTIASASVAAVLGLAGVSVAGAASTTGGSSATTTPTATATAPNAAPKADAQRPAAKKAARKARRRHFVRRGVAVAAKTINIEPADLVKEVRAGKTIGEVATAHGVQPQAVIDALETAATARIDKALTAGKITSERATRLKARLDVAVPKLVNDWHPKARRPAAG